MTPRQRLSPLIADWEFEVGALRHAKFHSVLVITMRGFPDVLTLIDLGNVDAETFLLF